MARILQCRPAMRARAAAVIVICGCGGGGPDPGPPDPPDPIFEASANGVDVTEGRWAGASDGWAGVSPWFSDSPSYLTEQMRSGACRLMASDVTYCEGCEGWCVSGTCVDWPAGRSAGPITIGGLSVPVTMTWMNDYYTQSPANPPDDLFDPGASITVSAPGDEVAAFTATVTGVEAVAPDLIGSCDNELHIARGEDAVLTWADPVPGSRVRLLVPSVNNGHGMPPRAVIECEGPDAGQLAIASALIDGLPPFEHTDACAGIACEGRDCPPATVARYTRAVAAAGAETVEIRAQSKVLFYVYDD
jgi:hypothetical protein